MFFHKKINQTMNLYSKKDSFYSFPYYLPSVGNVYAHSTIEQQKCKGHENGGRLLVCKFPRVIKVIPIHPVQCS